MIHPLAARLALNFGTLAADQIETRARAQRLGYVPHAERRQMAAEADAIAEQADAACLPCTARLFHRIAETHRTAGLLESSPPLWKWGVALGLAAVTVAAAVNVAPKLVAY